MKQQALGCPIEKKINLETAFWIRFGMYRSPRDVFNVHHGTFLIGVVLCAGQLKISVQYTRGELHVMIQHGRNLQVDDNEELPSPYVKTYLLPDAHKVKPDPNLSIRAKTNQLTKPNKTRCNPFLVKLVERGARLKKWLPRESFQNLGNLEKKRVYLGNLVQLGPLSSLGNWVNTRKISKPNKTWIFFKNQLQNLTKLENENSFTPKPTENPVKPSQQSMKLGRARMIAFQRP